MLFIGLRVDQPIIDVVRNSTRAGHQQAGDGADRCQDATDRQGADKDIVQPDPFCSFNDDDVGQRLRFNGIKSGPRG